MKHPLSSLKSLQDRLRPRSLNAKLLLPIVGLMLASLLTSTLAFGLGTLQTRNQLINQQLVRDQAQVSQVLSGRADTVRSASTILAADPVIAQAIQTKTDTNLATIDSRAVLVRNRFQLDLIQVYDASGDAWANLVLAELYRVSSLLDQVPPDSSVVIVVDENILLLSRSSLQDGNGTIITGIDLGSELERIASDQRLVADLIIRYAGAEESSLLEGTASEPGASVSREQPISLGNTPLTLVIRRQTAEIAQVSRAGLLVMVVSSLLTTAMLVILASWLTPAMVGPIRDLARLAQTVAVDHDFDVVLPDRASKLPLKIGTDDEIGQLTDAFSSMLIELRELTQSLEQKVDARTRQLSAASAVARAASSSLELSTVLQTVVDMISQKFGFYFAGVFLIEPDQSSAVLRAATGQVGDIFDGNTYLALPLDKVSHVTTAIQTGQPVVIQDISTSKTYLPHPLLSETRAEAVFPLAHAGNVMGALDIQSADGNIFTPDLLETFAILSDQIAVAAQNAQLYRQQREIASRLVEIDHLKAQFLSTVTHELRTPLNAIIGFSKLLVRGVDGALNETQLRDLTAIYENGQHLLSLIDDILDFSRIEAGQMALNIETVDLRSEVVGMTDQVEKWIGDQPIHLEFDLLPDIPLIEGDVIRLRQVLRNLLSNAVKFTRAGSITVTIFHNPQWLVVNIKDTGIGIAAGDMEKLFQPFSQVDGETNRKFEGNGLGLSISRYLIELHGGKIWAESTPGAGSTFSFALPVKQKSSPQSLKP